MEDKPEFEQYLVGDLGRAFLSSIHFSKRTHQLDGLQSKIDLFFQD
ncbi:hypothetical protein P872_13590 [Rhodonellum psychrophilum GCM71 = DSM 17998]|uniref:Uncharacterized protein n=1 Tax=Rhodonellum psychrophilum GCM71 = DSM 17998 TaxID=1123057 RepID=U5BUQ8_9BACT|nr:hypothetical protein P872_13590 [Rhodonellum psychrophilum GCM71 = DSM 17998]